MSSLRELVSDQPARLDDASDLMQYSDVPLLHEREVERAEEILHGPVYRKCNCVDHIGTLLN